MRTTNLGFGGRFGGRQARGAECRLVVQAGWAKGQGRSGGKKECSGRKIHGGWFVDEDTIICENQREDRVDLSRALAHDKLIRSESFTAHNNNVIRLGNPRSFTILL